MSHGLPAKTQRLLDLAKPFLKLGITAFGRPAAHVATFLSALRHQLDGKDRSERPIWPFPSGAGVASPT
jgi:hypothetical protein